MITPADRQQRQTTMTDNDNIKNFIAEFLRLPAEKLSDDTMLADFLADSFQAVEMLMALQEEFGFVINHEDLTEIESLGGLLALIASKR